MAKYKPESIETYRIVEKMIIYGGSFVKTLGELYMRADSINQRKILNTWENYFDEYSEKFNEKTHENS